MTSTRRRSDATLWAFSAAALSLLALYLASGRGRLDFQGYALGRDFVNAWSAGHLLREGRPLTVFDPKPFLAAARRLVDPALPFHFWSYPPPTLLMVAPLGWTSYFGGLLAWTAIGLGALALALRTFARAASAQATPPVFWLVLLAPATAVNIGLGQNGAFSAALLIAGLAMLDRRPWLAGALLGLLVFKPQIALLLPVMVLAGRRWRVMGGAMFGAGGLVLASLAVFGLGVWTAFVAHTLPMQTQMLRFGSGPFQTMMPSAYMSARLLGASWAWALVSQAPFTAVAAALVWRAWRRPAAPAVRAGVLMAATFVASPQAFNYDLAPVAVAAALLWRLAPGPETSGSRAGEVATTLVVGLAWILPAVMAASALPNIGWALRRAPLAPLVLTALTLRLADVGGLLAPHAFRRRARASTAGQAASNT